MKTARILIIEDDLEINQLVARYLTKEGFDTHSALTGKDALTYIANHEYHLVLLDLMLPIVDGQEILRKIREKNTLPVIILSAKDREMDKIRGLELGADDYMTKLLKRIPLKLPPFSCLLAMESIFERFKIGRAS